jgi:hypothetical protein
MHAQISFRMLYALNIEGKNKEEKESKRDQYDVKQGFREFA